MALKDIQSLTSKLTSPSFSVGSLLSFGSGSGNTSSLTSLVRSSAGTIGSTIGSALSGRSTSSTLASLTSSLVSAPAALVASLFRSNTPPPTATRFTAPPAMHVEAIQQPASGASTSSGSQGSFRSTSTNSSSAGSVVVNISAIDSKSFLEHSDAIASAVQNALLNSHPLKDVL